MHTLEEICQKLNIDCVSREEEFKNGPWAEFLVNLKKKPIRTLSYKEAYLGWLLILKFKPAIYLELGSQHGHSGMIWWDALKKIGSKLIALDLGVDPRNAYSDASIGTMELLPDDPGIIKVWGDAEECLPNLLKTHKIEFIFHDSAHTWNHVENCLNIVKNDNKLIIQACHDCGKEMWKPNVTTQYGVICAERPVFDKHYLDNADYYYAILEDKYGYGVTISLDLLTPTP